MPVEVEIDVNVIRGLTAKPPQYYAKKGTDEYNAVMGALRELGYASVEKFQMAKKGEYGIMVDDKCGKQTATALLKELEKQGMVKRNEFSEQFAAAEGPLKTESMAPKTGEKTVITKFGAVRAPRQESIKFEADYGAARAPKQEKIRFESDSGAVRAPKQERVPFQADMGAVRASQESINFKPDKGAVSPSQRESIDIKSDAGAVSGYTKKKKGEPG